MIENSYKTQTEHCKNNIAFFKYINIEYLKANVVLPKKTFVLLTRNVCYVCYSYFIDPFFSSIQFFFVLTPTKNFKLKYLLTLSMVECSLERKSDMEM